MGLCIWRPYKLTLVIKFITIGPFTAGRHVASMLVSHHRLMDRVIRYGAHQPSELMQKISQISLTRAEL